MRFLQDTSSAISSGRANLRTELDIIFEEYRSQITKSLSNNGYRTSVKLIGDIATTSAIGIGISEVNETVGLIHDLAPIAGAVIGAWGKFPNIEEAPVIGPIVQHTKRLSQGANKKLVEMSMRPKSNIDSDKARQVSVYSGVAFNENAARAHVSDIPKFS